MTRARTVEELRPLVLACRGGRLEEVREWIAQGRPIDVPEDASPRRAPHYNPLRVAIDEGFYDLAKILLEAGVSQKTARYTAIEHAVHCRRADIAELLLDHGAALEDIPVLDVVDPWNPAMVELLVARGADLESKNPIAFALMSKARPALGFLKQHAEKSPRFMHQANFALRYHARECNVKWVSLFLWAGADPWANGHDLPQQLDEPADDEDCGVSAVWLACLCGHLEILKLKNFLCYADDAPTAEINDLLSGAKEPDVLALLLERGYTPDRLDDKGTRVIDVHLRSMALDTRALIHDREPDPRGIDSERARDHMKAVHMLVANGAKWLPPDKRRITETRRSMLKMSPDYLLEFAWLMKTYQAARRADVEALFKAPSMAQRLGDKRELARKLVAEVPIEVGETGSGRGST